MHRLLFLIPALLLAACGGDAHHHDAAGTPVAAQPVHSDESDAQENLAPVNWDEAGVNAAIEEYLTITQLLAADTFEGVTEAGGRLSQHLATGGDEYEGEDSRFKRASTHAARLAAAGDIEEARDAFGHLSPPFVSLVRATGTAEDQGLYRMVCGMADVPGDGVWLQRGDEVRNPYFGSGMLRCAREVEAL